MVKLFTQGPKAIQDATGSSIKNDSYDKTG